MTESRDWQARLAAMVGRNVKQLRESRTPKLSAQALSDRTLKVGHHIQRPVITNLENGRRASVTLTDMFALARALNVPPFALIAPLTVEEPVEVLPGEFMSPWHAVDWFNGRSNYVADEITAEDEGFGEWYHVSDIYEHRFRYEVTSLLYIDAYRLANRTQGVEQENALGQVSRYRYELEQIAGQLRAMGAAYVPEVPRLNAGEIGS